MSEEQEAEEDWQPKTRLVRQCRSHTYVSAATQTIFHRRVLRRKFLGQFQTDNNIFDYLCLTTTSLTSTITIIIVVIIIIIIIIKSLTWYSTYKLKK